MLLSLYLGACALVMARVAVVAFGDVTILSTASSRVWDGFSLTSTPSPVNRRLAVACATARLFASATAALLLAVRAFGG
jgi:hypothetical protein